MSAVVLLCGNVFDVPPMPRGRHRSTPGTQTSLLRCSKQHHIRIADFQGANKLVARARDWLTVKRRNSRWLRRLLAVLAGSRLAQR